MQRKHNHINTKKNSKHSSKVKSNTMQKNKDIRLLMTFIILAFSVYIISAFATTAMTISDNSKKIADLNSKIVAEQIKNDQLKQTMQKIDTPEYKTQIARQRDGLVLPTEVIFVNVLAEDNAKK
ncbi:MAG: septum formation initiator family protein [Clostridiales bacterium]|jgi:cell division protein FtsL|nr:septum formation initiator family protein [Clostridiales bacterium]